MNRRLAVFVTALGILAGAGVFVWKHKPGVGGAFSTSTDRTEGGLHPEEGVLEAYRMLEKASREGDGELLLSLQSREATKDMTDAQRAAFPKHFPPDPGLRYVPLASGAIGSRGAVIGRIEGATRSTGKYETVRFVFEGAWKVALESFSESPLDPRGLFAIVLPAQGTFARAGSPWRSIPYANLNTQFFKDGELDWKMQATHDESYLYVRFEAKAQLPTPGVEVYADKSRPGSPVNSGVPSLPVIKIQLNYLPVTGSRAEQEFRLQAGDVISTLVSFCLP